MMNANLKLTNIETRLHRRLNLLLIDDDDICLLFHRKLAETSGVFRKIRSACNGKKALEILKRAKRTMEVPDIIILDLNMPVMGGLAFLEAFQQLDLKNKKRISTVVLTSIIDPNERQFADSLGVRHYLMKPLAHEALNSVVDSFNKMDVKLPEILSHSTANLSTKL